MFCSSCGNQLESTARFCSTCGAACAPGSYPPRPVPLTRTREPRMVGGVCAGIALHYGWDIAIVRIVVLMFALFSGIGFVFYLVAWIAIPEAPLGATYTAPPTYPDTPSERNSTLA